MTDVVKCAVYYDSAGLPFLCHDLDCVGCEYDCFDAVVKIIPLEVDIEQETLEVLSKGLEKTGKNVERFSKEMKKTMDRLSKLKNRFK